MAPFHILNIPTAVADEVVMPYPSRIESRGAALDGHLAYQTRLHQVPQIVISRGPGRARIHPIHDFKNFRSRGMPVAVQQECHHSIALRGTAQTGVLQGLSNCRSVHKLFGIYLI